MSSEQGTRKSAILLMALGEDRAAAALHVHVNTVAQRLERIGTLLGAGWQEPDRALEIQLALRLHRLGAPGRTG